MELHFWLIPILAILVISVASFYLIILLRGSLLQAMSSLLVILICGLFVLRRNREDTDDARI